MADLNSVISVLNATILSTKSSVTLEQCNRDYKELEGRWIPFKELGYKSLIDFIDNLPGFRLVRLANGNHVVEAKKSSEVKHITDMVARQKATKPKHAKYHLQRPPRNIRFGTSGRPPSYDYSKSQRAPVPNKPFFKYPKPRINNREPMAAPQHVQKNPLLPTPAHVQKTPLLHTPILPTPKLAPPKPQNIPNDKPTSLKDSSVKSEPKPTSKLSGIKPGDILARSQSSPHSGSSNGKDVKSEPLNNYSVPLNNKSNAANRLSTLQNNLQTTDFKFNYPPPEEKKEKIEVITPVEAKHKPMMRQESLDLQLKDLPNNKSRFLKCCEFLGLSEPVFKIASLKEKRGILYDCTVKIGNTYSFATYPNSLPTEEQAVETVSLLGINQLKKVIAEELYPVSSDSVAISRIVQIVSNHPNGLWANTLPDLYKGEYKEYLPGNWLKLIDQCSSITKELGMKDMIMLLPIMKSSVVVSSVPPLETVDVCKERIGPPALQFPEDNLWNVYVMSAYSTVEVWLRIIGEEYSEAFENLITDMEMYFLENAQASKGVEEGGWYALNSDDSWMRIRILEINPIDNTALCFLVDSGDEEIFPFEVFYDLPPEFLALPPQAVLCRLAGLEEFAMVGEIGGDRSFLSDLLSEKILVAEVLQTPNEKQDDPSITVVLFDTSTDNDININKELLRKFSEKATTPQLPSGITEVYVMDVTTSGKVSVQIHNDSWKLLQNMLHQISSGPFPLESLQASYGEIVPSPSIHYLVKSLSGDWRRGILRSGVNEDSSGVKCVSVRYIDCGRTESVPVKDLIMLERVSDALNNFPPQVLYLTLYNVGTLNAEQMDKINSLVPKNAPVLCKQIVPGSTIVELFVRTQPHNVLCSVNNALILEKEFSAKLLKDDRRVIDPKGALLKKKERYIAPKNSSNSLNSSSKKLEKPFKLIPEKGTYFDVMVCMASNPRNFVVQPLQHLQELTELMMNMQDVCEKLPCVTSPLSKNKLYAVLYQKDKQWYRASFLGMASQHTPSLHFVDYGDYYSSTLDNIRELPNEFAVLPPMAIRAKLYGVRPKDQDWTVEDCIRFIELVNEQSFASVVKDIEESSIDVPEPVLVLDLIDTSTHEDLYVNALLVKERRAIPL